MAKNAFHRSKGIGGTASIMAANVVRTSAAMSPIFSSGANSVICSQKTGSFLTRVFRVDFLGWGGAEDDESLEVLGRTEGIYFEAGSRDGVPVADICRKAGISQATYFNWKKKYDGLQPPEMRRLKQLEEENSKLKKLVADLSLDREMLQDVIRRKL
jgi:putative transposase